MSFLYYSLKLKRKKKVDFILRVFKKPNYNSKRYFQIKKV